jgi:hypothetical protein
MTLGTTVGSGRGSGQFTPPNPRSLGPRTGFRLLTAPTGTVPRILATVPTTSRHSAGGLGGALGQSDHSGNGHGRGTRDTTRPRRTPPDTPVPATGSGGHTARGMCLSYSWVIGSAVEGRRREDAFRVACTSPTTSGTTTSPSHKPHPVVDAVTTPGARWARKAPSSLAQWPGTAAAPHRLHVPNDGETVADPSHLESSGERPPKSHRGNGRRKRGPRARARNHSAPCCPP